MEQEEGVVSLKDLINSAKELFTELKLRWLMISIIICSTSALGLAYSFLKKPKYIATSTMMLENSESPGGSVSGALALASQFGLMGSSSSSSINGDKLVEIIKAETVIKTALYKKATIDSKTDILANHFLDLFGYRKQWEKDNDSLKNFRFTNTKDKLTIEENRIFKMIYSQITQSMLTSDKMPKSGIISISIRTKSELFSKYFNESLVQAMTSFYVNGITQKGRANIEIVQKRVDSIALALKNAEFALAGWRDSNFQLVKARGMIAEMELRRNVEFNNSIYIEGIKQLEMSKFSLLQQTPFLQIIDGPTLPLEPEGITPPLQGLSLGLFIGFLISCGYVFARKKYSESVTEG